MPARAGGAHDCGLGPHTQNQNLLARRNHRHWLAQLRPIFQLRKLRPHEETGSESHMGAVSFSVPAFFLSQVLLPGTFLPPTNRIQFGCRRSCRRRHVPHEA